jgi:hypothetical protein
MTGMDEQAVRESLANLTQAHRTLDEQIRAIESVAAPNQLHLTRLKKRKLALKDEIARLEDMLVPDIPA